MNASHVLGINFLMGGGGADASLHKQPARMIAELAQSSDALPHARKFDFNPDILEHLLELKNRLK